jgi:DNA-binding MarR family transcriptional regulator
MTMTAPTRPRLDTSVRTWLRLARVFQKIHQRSVDELRAEGLSVGQFDVLAHVGAAEGLTQQDLAEALLVTKGNVCQLLGRMEQTGLLERHQDGRANRLALTSAGEALLAQALPAHQALIAEQLSALTPDEQVQLLGLLRTLDHALGAGAPDPQLDPSDREAIT